MLLQVYSVIQSEESGIKGTCVSPNCLVRKHSCHADLVDVYSFLLFNTTCNGSHDLNKVAPAGVPQRSCRPVSNAMAGPIGRLGGPGEAGWHSYLSILSLVSWQP